MFLKSPYFWRTYLVYAAVVFAGIFLFAASLIGETDRKILSAMNTQMETTAELLSLAMGPALRNLNYQEIIETADSVHGTTGLRVTIIDSNGLVLADTHENPFNMNNHLRRPEIQQAFREGTGNARRYSFTLEQDFIYLASRLNEQGQVAGFVRVAKSVDELSSEMNQAKLPLLRNSAAVTFLLLLLVFYLVARQTTKVEELEAGAEEISRGNFTKRIPVSNAVGLRKIAEAINQMARSSARSVTEVTADRNRLSTIFTCMVEGVMDVDMNQNILHINDAAAHMLSIDTRECLGKPIWEEIRAQEIIGALDEALKTQSVIKTQVRLIREADHLVVDIYAASLSDDEGEPIGAVLVLHDITELKNLERVRTDFVANASHELKTPITAIRGLTETILGDDTVDQETLSHFIERVHAQSLRLSQLIGDLLTISRLESTQGSKDFELINLSELVKQAVITATGTAQEKGHQLDLGISPEKIMVYGDRQNLNQLLDNLIDNAIKYTPEPGQILVTLSEEDNDAVCRVKDSGVGISPQFQQRVFERFYRVDKARSQSLGGTGLGLSIVKNIAEKHDGSVSVKSQLGNGSTFTFRIPLSGRNDQAS